MEGGSATHVSDFVNYIVGASWLEYRTTSASRKVKIDVLPILKDGLWSNSVKLASSDQERREITVDRVGMEKLSSKFKASSPTSFEASSTTSDTVSKDTILNVKQRLAQVRPHASAKDYSSAQIILLAEKLINMTSCDKWLLRHFQTSNFDGTWVSIFCGLYQSLYLYHTEIVEQCPWLSNKVLPKAKIMVLLLRWQHLQCFQRLYTQGLMERSVYQDLWYDGMTFQHLFDEELLINSLISSLRWTAVQMDIWANDQSLNIFKISQNVAIEVEEPVKAEERFKSKKALELKLDERHIPPLNIFLANIFHNANHFYFFEDDKWLWKYLHSLNAASTLLGNWAAIICVLYQGLYLYGKNEDLLSEEMEELSGISNLEEKSQKMKDGSLTILLFRSIHLHNFESKWKETCKNILQLKYSKLQKTTVSQKVGSVLMSTSAIGMAPGAFRIGTRLGLTAELADMRKVELEMMHLWHLLGRDLQESIMVTEDIIKSYLEKGSCLDALDCDCQQIHNVNVFLGSSSLPNGIRVEELLDLQLLYVLGGLICTIIEVDPNNNEGNDHTSWCIIRHNTTNFFFCVDLKNDEYGNKQRVLDGKILVEYKGLVEVSTMDGQTTLKSFELDGSCYEGGLEDFADRRGKKNPLLSCAEKALHILPQSDFLQEFNLKCSVLHMFALANLAGNKDYLKLKWRGDAGHIEYVTHGEDGQSQGSGDYALRKCNVLYTHEGRLIGEDIIWEGDCAAQRDGPSQDKNGEGLKVCVNKTETTRGERDKVHIITKHYTSYVQRGVIQDTMIMGEDQITARLIEAREEAEEALLVPADIASAFANLKQNSGLGVGAAGVKIEGHHEYRPQDANIGIVKFLQGFTVKHHLKATVVVLPDLYQCIVDDLQARLTSGTIAEHPREFFVVKTRGSCSLQVFLCNPQDFTQGFNWLTDIVVSDKNVAENIFKNKLKGKTLTISRTDSEMLIDPDIPAGKFFSQYVQPVQNRFMKQQGEGVVTEETMVHAFQLQSFPHSNDDWKFIVGERRKYNRANWFLKATECQAIVCSGTRFTTGGALIRSMKQRCGTHFTTSGARERHVFRPERSQPSTSSSSAVQQWLFHGSCKKVCTSRFCIEDDKVTATGKFSTFKGISNWPDVYWG